jgi:hypothetical protein
MMLSKFRKSNFVTVILVGLFMIAKMNGLLLVWNCCSHENRLQLTSASVNSCCSATAFAGDQVNSEKHCHCIHHIFEGFVSEPIEVMATIPFEWIVNIQHVDDWINQEVFITPVESVSDHWQIKRWRIPLSGAEIRICLSSFLN